MKNNNPVSNRRRLARRIWKRFIIGYFAHVLITYGAEKDFRKVHLFYKFNQCFVQISTIEGPKWAFVPENAYQFLIDEIKKADDIKCFGNKFVTKEWNALCYMKAYSYQKLVFSDCGGCYIAQ